MVMGAVRSSKAVVEDMVVTLLLSRWTASTTISKSMVEAIPVNDVRPGLEAARSICEELLGIPEEKGLRMDRKSAPGIFFPPLSAIQQFLECWLLGSLRTFCNFFFENHTQIQCFNVKITINK